MANSNLNKLANYLQGLNDPEFTLHGWPHCAIGCAVRDHVFAGLTLVVSGSPIAGLVVPHYDGLTAFDAVAQLFEIPRTDAVDLFSTVSYRHVQPTSKEVADKIRRYLVAHQVKEIIADAQRVPEPEPA